MKKILLISGPTASGKTRTSIELAKYLISKHKITPAIVNFDSLLFYREISIGTAKPTLEERANIDHYMIDIESITGPMNAAQYIQKAEKVIDELLGKNKFVILVGGSAFYLRALLKGMYDSNTPSEDLKIRLNELYKNFGITPFLQILRENDPESLSNLHPNDHYRIIRAVEHFEQTGSKISEQKKILDNDLPYDFSQIEKDWTILHFYLDLPKEKHFEIIKSRTRSMIDSGLQDEINNLLTNGFDINLKPLQSIGYKEVIAFMNGEFSSLEECMDRINISTRQLAKSQRTFFNKINPKLSFDPTVDLALMKSQLDLFLQG